MLSTAPDSYPRVTAIYREPFKLGSPIIRHLPAGSTIADIVRFMPNLPADFGIRGTVMIDGHLIPSDRWNRVRPRADRGAIVTFHMAVRGGGEGGDGKQVAAIIAALAIAVISAGVAGGWAAGLITGYFAAGSASAAFLAASISLAGTLLVSALTSTPTRKQDGADGNGNRSLEPASITGNVLEPNAPIPRVIGTRRIFPPFATEPTIEIIGQDEVVHGLYCLAGPHALSNPRLGDTAFDPDESGTDTEFYMNTGLPGELPLPYAERYSRTFPTNVELSTHGTNAENLGNYEPPLPTWHGTNSADAPDEIWLHFMMLGLLRQAEPTAALRVPIRIRMRLRGDTDWRYLPELHYMDVTQQQRRFQVKIRFGEGYTSTLPPPPTTRGFVEARKSVPAQNVSPLGTVWDADSYFSAGAGNDSYRNGTEGTTNVQHLTLETDIVTVYLDETWTPGIYDIEVKRAATIKNSNYTPATYTHSGSILDLFGMRDTNVLPLTRDGLLDRLQFLRAVSVKNDAPIMPSDMALMYVKARNRSIGSMSVVASGYVHDLNVDVPDAMGAQHVFYCKFDGVDGATAAVDESPNAHALTFNGDAQLDTARKKFGVSGLLLDGTGDYITTPYHDEFAIAAGEKFTLGVQVYSVSTAAARQIFNKWNATGNQRSFSIQINAAGAVVFAYSTTGTDNLQIASATGLVVTGQFYYIEVTRDAAGVIRVFLDGVVVASATYAGAFFNSTAGLSIGATSSGASPLNGTIDQVEFIKGDALHTADFSPPGAGDRWTDMRTTSNPAPHYRDILSGILNFDPLPDALHDNDALIAWRNVCEDQGLTCDMISEGTSLSEVLRIVASCGYARPYQSEIWGIIRDYDRAAESPVQLFSPRNMAEFRWTKAFPRLPDGLRVTYKEEDAEYAGRQIVVYRDGISQTDKRTEQISYEGLITREAVTARAKFDLKQAQYRSILYSFSAPVESIVCRRGSLIAVNHDVLLNQHGFARVVDVTRDSGGLVTHVLLDCAVELTNNPGVNETANINAIDDMNLVGIQSGFAVRRTNGTNAIYPAANAGMTNEIELTTPTVDAAIDDGCLVVVGTVGKEYKRLIVSEISPGPDLTAQLTLVDEAPELWS